MKSKMTRSFCLIICLSTLLYACVGCAQGTGNDDVRYEGGIFGSTVKFQTNGGSKIDSVVAKTIVTAPTTTRTGHLFDGWYLDETLTVAAVFPLSISNDTTIYAKWLKLTDTIQCKDVSIKMWKDHSAGASWTITPSGFDLDRLAKLGYTMSITVTYSVYYKKDYDALWDIGYAGAPKYEAYIINSKLVGTYDENMTTTTTSQTRTISYTHKVVDIKDEKLTLNFSTDNIQNIIYFKDISVSYRCYK